MNLLLSIFGIISFLLALLASLIFFLIRNKPLIDYWQWFYSFLAQMFIIFIVYSGLIMIPHIYSIWTFGFFDSTFKLPLCS
jgi:phosphoglycerol transferase MdoB-like AlkP superfamily enzyme